MVFTLLQPFQSALDPPQGLRFTLVKLEVLKVFDEPELTAKPANVLDDMVKEVAPTALQLRPSVEQNP